MNRLPVDNKLAMFYVNQDGCMCSGWHSIIRHTDSHNIQYGLHSNVIAAIAIIAFSIRACWLDMWELVAESGFNISTITFSALN